jgi:hypothetical protein
MDNGALSLEPQGVLGQQTLWQTNPNLAMIAAMRGRGLFGAMALKEQAVLDQQRRNAVNQQTNQILTSAPNDQILSPADLFRHRAAMFANVGRLDEANKMGDVAKKLDNDLEFRDGVWYDKRSGKPYSAGHMINQQGFGIQTQLGPNGQIGMGPLPGAAQTYGLQQQVGEDARARYDLQKVPASSPTAQPTFASRLQLLQGQTPAGMSPQMESQVAADAAQQTEVSKNYATMFNNLQNASMSNPAKIARFQQIGNLLGDFEGGKFSKAGLELAKAFNSAGLKIDPRLPNKEAAEAMANEVALELRSPAAGAGMPGAMSDQDREFLKSMVPQMAQTAEGRTSIINSRVKVMERENQVANMARQYRQKYGKLDENFFSQLQEWSNRNHIFPKK